MKTRFAAALLAEVLCGISLFAQSERGTIRGTVRDASGAVVPAANVTLTNSQTGISFSLPSNASGEFTVPQLPVGTYTVKFEKEGFRPADGDRRIPPGTGATARQRGATRHLGLNVQRI